MQSFKSAMEKMKKVSSDIQQNLSKWLLYYRNTPNTTTRQTPAVLMLGRPTRTLLSLLDPLTAKKPNYPSDLLTNTKTRMCNVGDRVYAKDIRSDSWQEGIIVGKEGCKVYIVRSRGVQERRHIDHLVSAMEHCDIDRPFNSEIKPALHKPVEHQTEHKQVEHEQISEPVQSNAPLVLPVDRPVPMAVDKSVPPKPVVCNETPEIRRSLRPKSMVDRLNYKKLGGI